MWAQAYPNHPPRIIVGQAAGSSSDIIARLIGQHLSERFNQQFIIETRPGAGGNIATDAVAHAPADGYTILLVNAQNSINAALYDKLNFDFVRDIAPVAGVFLFKFMAGVDMVHVPYRGTTPAVTDLLAGQVQVMFDVTPTSLPHIRAGKLRPLAVTTAGRIDVLPELAPLNEFLPGYEASAWIGFGVPKNTPAEVIAALNRAVNAAITDAKIKARIADLGGIVLPPGTPAEFGKLIADDIAKWKKVVQAAGLKPE